LIPVLLTIPLDAGIARAYSRGIPLVEHRPQWKGKFQEVFQRIEEMADERNRGAER
jgi:hypothetical protein